MKRAALATLGVGALLALLALGLHAQAGEPEATVTYFVIPGCSTCAHTADALRRVLAPYGERVRLRIVENRSAEGLAAKRQYGFLSHGLVLTDRKGKAELVESDHRVFPEHVIEALGRVLPQQLARQ
jgi:hypothetical protein